MPHKEHWNLWMNWGLVCLYTSTRFEHAPNLTHQVWSREMHANLEKKSNMYLTKKGYWVEWKEIWNIALIAGTRDSWH